MNQKKLHVVEDIGKRAHTTDGEQGVGANSKVITLTLRVGWDTMAMDDVVDLGLCFFSFYIVPSASAAMPSSHLLSWKVNV